MSSAEADLPRRVNQLRHDVDDVYELLSETNDTVKATNQRVGEQGLVQRRQGNRLEEIQQALDLQNGRLDRIEDTQRQQGTQLTEILDLLRGGRQPSD